MSKGHEYHSTALDRLSSRLQRTVFVGGIPLKSSPADIEAYLSTFDIVEAVMLPKNKLTGQLRGYAKATMRTLEGVERLLNFPHHCISGLNVGVSRWTTTDDYLVRKKDISSRKVYVKFKARIGVDNVIAYFSTFGVIEQFDIKRNPFTGRFRDFGYLTYEDQRSAREVIDLGLHTIGGEVVRCELSKPNLKTGESWQAPDYFEVPRHEASGNTDLKFGKLNNKFLPTKTDGNRLEPALPAQGGWNAQKRPHRSSDAVEGIPDRADKFEEFCIENNIKEYPSSSANDQNSQPKFKKSGFQKQQYSESNNQEFEPEWTLKKPKLLSAACRIAPTSKLYSKEHHEMRELNHLKPKNLKFRVHIATLVLPDELPPLLF